MQENKNPTQPKTSPPMDKSLEELMKMINMPDFAYKDYNFLPNSTFFPPFNFFDSFNHTDIQSLNLLSQAQGPEQQTNPYNPSYNWNNYINNQLAMVDKKATEEMSNVFLGMDNPHFIRENPNTYPGAGNKNLNQIIKKEEEIAANTVVHKKERKKPERKEKKGEKQQRKTNLKNTYINKINNLLVERSEEEKPKKGRKHHESSHELSSLPNKPPFNKYDKDPVKRVKSYNIDPNEFGNGDQKLIRNRESARNSRKRKKIYIELLETKVSELSNELNEVKSLVSENQKSFQNLSVQSKVNEQVLNIKQLFEMLETGLKSRQHYGQIQTILDSLRNKNESMSKQRRNSLGYYFDQIIDIVLPVHMRYLLWAALKDKDVFGHSFENNNNTANEKKENKSSDPNENIENWSEALLSLGLADREKEEIIKHKGDLLQEKRYFEKIVKALVNIKVLLGNNIFNFETTIYDEIQSFLSTEQFAKVLIALEKQEGMDPNLVTKFQLDNKGLNMSKEPDENDLYNDIERSYDLFKITNDLKSKN